MNEVEILGKVWKDNSGWVSLPRKSTNPESVKGKGNHSGKWEDKMFKWPEDKEGIQEWIDNSKGYNMYWSPLVYNKDRRLKGNVNQVGCLYADLDEVTPDSIPNNLVPSMCWSSSPNRYAAVWLLDSPVQPWIGEQINKKLTYTLGADKGGWDLTQVLRIPGLRNYKYEGAPKGKLLWSKETEYSSQIFGELKEIDTDTPTEYDIIDSSPGKLPERVKPYLDIIDSKTMKKLFATELDVSSEDRSERIWEIECRLVELGIPKNDVLSIVCCTHWNKYRGRRDEMERLSTEIDKISVDTSKSPVKSFKQRQLVPYMTFMGQSLSEPGWLVEGIWQRSSHGMIAGEPKTYKSILATDLAISVASGTNFLGQFKVKHKGPVMMVQEENSPWVVQDRISKITHNRQIHHGKISQGDNGMIIKWPQNIPLWLVNNTGFDFTNPEDCKWLEAKVKLIKPVMLIFDPLYLMMGDKDENSSKDIRPMLNWLLHLRYDLHTAIVLIHHWNKHGKSDRGGQRMLGSVLLHGWVESAMYTSVVDEEAHKISFEREFRSFTKPGKVQVQFNMGEPGSHEYNPLLFDEVDTTDTVLELIKMNGPTTVVELMGGTGISETLLNKRLTSLKREGKITTSGKYISIA